MRLRHWDFLSVPDHIWAFSSWGKRKEAIKSVAGQILISDWTCKGLEWVATPIHTTIRKLNKLKSTTFLESIRGLKSQANHCPWSREKDR
jgi:hypothetical protein